MIDLAKLHSVVDAIPGASTTYYEVPIPGTEVKALSCEADQAMDDFLEAFSVETCTKLVEIAEAARDVLPDGYDEGKYPYVRVGDVQRLRRALGQ